MSEPTQAPPQSGMGVVSNPPPQFGDVAPPPVAPPVAAPPAPAAPGEPPVQHPTSTGGFMNLDPAQIARAAAFLKAAQASEAPPPPPEPAQPAAGGAKGLAEQLQAQLAEAHRQIAAFQSVQAEQSARAQFANASGQYRFKNTAVQDLAFRHFQANYDVDAASGAIRNKATGQFFFKDQAGTLGTLPDLISHLAQGELSPLFDQGSAPGQVPAAGIGHMTGQGQAADPYNWTPPEAWLDDGRNMRAMVNTGQKDRWIRTRQINKAAVDDYLTKNA